MRGVLLLQLYQHNINRSGLSWVSTSFISMIFYTISMQRLYTVE